MTQDTPIDTDTLDYDGEPQEGAAMAEGEWLEEPEEELPRRPRRKLLAPVPLALLVVLLLACAFFAGVKVEKGQTSSSANTGFPAGLAALRGRAGTGGASSSGATGSSSAGFPGASGAGSPGTSGAGFPGGGGLSGGGVTAGEVSFANGNTLYVTSSEGNTVKISAPAGTQVSKTVTTNVHSIHPGDTVIVRGTQNKNGSVSASSITVSASGGSGTSGAGSSSTGSGGAAQQLFGAG